MGLTRRLAATALLAAVVLPASVAAQDVAVKAGVNFSTDSNPYQDPSRSRRRGLVAGIAMRVPARDHFSVQFEGLYSEKGNRFGSGGIVGAAPGDLRIRYLELPVLGRADIGGPDASTRFYLVGGAAPAVRLSARLKIDIPVSGEVEVNRTNDIRKLDVGVIGGAGIEFGKLSIEARYTRGLLSIDANPRRGNTASITNRAFTVGLGYRVH